MSSPQSASPDQSFQSRLNRVADRRAPAEAAKPQVEVLPDWRANVSGPMGLVLALLIGALSVLLVRVASFHMTGTAMIGDNPDIRMVAETVAALSLSLILFRFLPYRGVQYGFIQFGGVVLMVSMMHNIVHTMPGPFSLIFSTDWTAEVTAGTEPNSLYLRGQSVPFTKPVEEEEEKPKLPTVRRMG